MQMHIRLHVHPLGHTQPDKQTHWICFWLIKSSKLIRITVEILKFNLVGIFVQTIGFGVRMRNFIEQNCCLVLSNGHPIASQFNIELSIVRQSNDWKRSLKLQCKCWNIIWCKHNFQSFYWLWTVCALAIHNSQFTTYNWRVQLSLSFICGHLLLSQKKCKNEWKIVAKICWRNPEWIPITLMSSSKQNKTKQIITFLWPLNETVELIRNNIKILAYFRLVGQLFLCSRYDGPSVKL